ncbi:MAG TPA: amidohydrolase family protein [Kofleriaceae bacterium]|nr:amidohydrolase family protein [Kofleriaceae bacterium]
MRQCSTRPWLGRSFSFVPFAAVALALALAAACGSSAAPRSPAQGPAGARVLRYEVITVGRPSGSGEVRIEADGTRRTHYTFNDRGRGPDVRTELRVDATGAPRFFRATGHAYEKQPVDERLDEQGGQLAWRSPSEHGQAPAGSGFYVPIEDSLGTSLVRALLRAPGRRLRLLPAGEAWIEGDHMVELPGRRLRQVAVAGLTYAPFLVWLDEEGELFAYPSSWISTIREGAASLIPLLLAAEQTWYAARAADLAKKLAHRPPAAGLAITHARVFDAERRAVIPDATVIVVGDRITAVGGAQTQVPAGAQVIDARGRTLLPGFWDMHVHVQDSTSVLALASGVTTVRDLGNDIDELSARSARITAGTELGPTILRSGFIDGPGKYAAPTGVLVSTPDEARAAVRRYADLGVAQIKVYSSVAPELVPVITAAAHERGLRVSGHVPMGMNAAQAVEAGFDELQHANFLFLQFLAGPTDDTRTPLRFLRVAERAASLDLGGAEVRAFLDLLAARRTVIDPTVAIFEALLTSDPGQMDPMAAPFAGRLPAQVERAVRGGGLPAPGGLRATYRASYEAMLRMVKLAYDRGIPVVAGTDAGGFAYPRELELYVRAGIPAPEVLALATLGAARVMRQDREVGSIAPGKRADLVLVDGDPTRDISAIRNADVVVCRGVVFDPAELLAASGIGPRKR